MNQFTYRALSPSGKEIRGMATGADEAVVYDQLTEQGLYVLHIRSSTRLFKYLSDKLLAWQIKRHDVIEFCANLATMLRAGIPLMTALDDIISTMSNQRMRVVVGEVRKNVELGVSFSNALSLYENAFPDILVRLVRVGEETGRIDNSLAEVAQHLQRLEDLSAAVRQAMIYPLFSLLTTGGAVIFWLVYVLPRMMEVIVGMGVKMPLLTRILYEASRFSVRFWYLFLVVPLVCLVLYQGMRIRPKTAYWIDLFKLKAPLFRTLVHHKLLALLAEQLRLLLSAGITIDRALEITADVMGNAVFRRRILEAREDVMSGKRLSASLSVHGVFPQLFIRMLTIGESSGRMEQQFGYLSEHYYKVVDRFSQKIGKIVEPVFLIVLGCIMGTMIAGILLPMYDIFSKVTG